MRSGLLVGAGGARAGGGATLRMQVLPGTKAVPDQKAREDLDLPREKRTPNVDGRLAEHPEGGHDPERGALPSNSLAPCSNPNLSSPRVGPGPS